MHMFVWAAVWHNGIIELEQYLTNAQMSKL